MSTRRAEGQISLGARGLLALMGLVTLGFGVAYLVSPVEMAALGGIAPTRPGALAEIRGYYGGLQVGMGVLFLSGLWRPRAARAGLYAAAILFAGNGTGRLLGVALAGGIDQFNLAGALFELGFSLGAITVVARGRRTINTVGTRRDTEEGS